MRSGKAISAGYEEEKRRKLAAFASERGESLVEILISVVIMATVFSAFLGALSTGAFVVATVREQVTAENIARAQLELIQHSKYCIPPLEVTTEAVTIQPGPDDGKDTYIRSQSDKRNDNFGNEDKLITSGVLWVFNIGRSLLQFDLSSIPKEATVDSAALDLYLFHDEGSQVDVMAHRLTTGWVEGTGGENAGATWYTYDGSNDWDTPGGDYDSVEAGSFEVSGEGWHTMDLTSLTQDWVNETYPNYGVILRSSASFSNEERYHSSDYNTGPSLRPLLAVTYTVTTTVQCYPTVVLPEGYAVMVASSVITPDLQAITVTVSSNGEQVFTIGDYKANR